MTEHHDGTTIAPLEPLLLLSQLSVLQQMSHLLLCLLLGSMLLHVAGNTMY